ncbi:TetR/AcrR family transcriptional regulator [Microtetraspora sp. AC03309]|uniref:TetR/AcrR family transcriptional regulator n=1 Tax=Microtetraspora sp. AC03309 TaxID=2779376 RepID=UPI001E4F96B8|nr:TetR/AcrR family transcriptional regulator [Microtetraspora sp. AC03309]MCC5579953.1 TetR/AcrR family transcriptional regulator [Microtetraspora sp. AC03309]
MGNRKVEQGETTRTALVEAAAALFAEKGYADTSTGEVVARANVTRGALYHHFADKEEIFRAVLETVEGDIFDRVNAATAASIEAGAGDPASLLRVGTDTFLDACLERPVQRILLQESTSVLGWSHWQRLDNPRCPRRLLAHGLAQAVDAGMIADQPAEPLTHLLYGALVQAGMIIAGADDPVATRAAMGTAVERLLDALFAAGTGRPVRDRHRSLAL